MEHTPVLISALMVAYSIALWVKSIQQDKQIRMLKAILDAHLANSNSILAMINELREQIKDAKQGPEVGDSFETNRVLAFHHKIIQALEDHFGIRVLVRRKFKEIEVTAPEKKAVAYLEATVEKIKKHKK